MDSTNLPIIYLRIPPNLPIRLPRSGHRNAVDRSTWTARKDLKRLPTLFPGPDPGTALCLLSAFSFDHFILALTRRRPRGLSNPQSVPRPPKGPIRHFDVLRIIKTSKFEKRRPQPIWCRLVIDTEKLVNQSGLTCGRRKRLLELGGESRRIFQNRDY
jgi:hypothetical protein